jgi:hypothetical protein
MIAQWQIEQFHQQGFLVVEGCFPRRHRRPAERFRRLGRREPPPREVWGETLDGRPRFDLESDHAPDHPSLRRVVPRRRFPPPIATPR